MLSLPTAGAPPAGAAAGQAGVRAGLQALAEREAAAAAAGGGRRATGAAAGAAAHLQRVADAVLLAPALPSGGGWLGVKEGERGALCAEGVAAAVVRLGASGHANLAALLDALVEALLVSSGGAETLSLLLALGGEGSAGLPTTGSGALARLQATGCSALRELGHTPPPLLARGPGVTLTPAAVCELEPELRLLSSGRDPGPKPLLRSVGDIEGGVSSLGGFAEALEGDLRVPDITDAFAGDLRHPLNPFRGNLGGAQTELAGPSGRRGSKVEAGVSLDGWTRLLPPRGGEAMNAHHVDVEVRLQRHRTGSLLTDSGCGDGEIACSWCEVCEGQGGTAGGETLPEEHFVRAGLELLSGSPSLPIEGALRGCRIASTTSASVGSAMTVFARSGSLRRGLSGFVARLEFDWRGAAVAAAKGLADRSAVSEGFSAGGADDGGVLRAFLQAVKEVLRQYDDSLGRIHATVLRRRRVEAGGVALDGGTRADAADLCPVTLLELLFHTGELRADLARLAATCWCCAEDRDAGHPRWERENFPRGTALLDMLYQEALGADAASTELLQFLFRSALEPYFHYLTNWLFFGKGAGDLAHGGAQDSGASAFLTPEFLDHLRDTIIHSGQQLRVLHRIPCASPFVSFLETFVTDPGESEGGVSVGQHGVLPRACRVEEVVRFRSYQRGLVTSVSAAAGRLLDSLTLRREREAEEVSKYLRYVRQQRVALIEAARVSELEALAAAREKREEYAQELRAVISERKAAAEEAQAQAIEAERAALDAVEREEVAQLKADIEKTKSRLEATEGTVRKNIQRMRWQRQRLQLSASRRLHESRIALEERLGLGSSPVRALKLTDASESEAEDNGAETRAAEVGARSTGEAEAATEGAPDAVAPTSTESAAMAELAGENATAASPARNRDGNASPRVGDLGGSTSPVEVSMDEPSSLSVGTESGSSNDSHDSGSDSGDVGGASVPVSGSPRPSEEVKYSSASPASPLGAAAVGGADDRYTMRIFDAVEKESGGAAGSTSEAWGGHPGEDGVPLQVFVDSCIATTVRDHYAVVSGLTVRIFLEELRLLEQLDFLRGAFLLCDGEFARALIERLDGHHFQGLALNNWQLEDMLEAALGSSNLGKGYGARLELRLNALLGAGDGRKGRPGSVKGVLEALELTYRCEGPLVAVLTADAMGQYNRAFQALLQLRWARAALSTVWERTRLLQGRLRRWIAGGALGMSVLEVGEDEAWDGGVSSWVDTPEPERQELLRRMHRLELFRHEMNHFVAALEGFVLGQLEGGAREGLHRGMAGAPDLRGLKGAHSAYLDAAQRCCFLGPGLGAASDFVGAILQRAVDLQALCRASPGLTLVRGEAHWRKIQALHLSFKNTVHLLFRLLRAARHPQLAELGLLLDPNAFYGFPASSGAAALPPGDRP